MSPERERLRLLLVDDHTLVRSGFSSLLQQMDELEVVGEAADGQSAIETALELKPDIILMDMRLPDMSGIEATRRILAELPDTRVLGLSVFDDHQFVAQMFKAGAFGYLVKDCSASELREAIGEVSQRRRYLGKTVAAGVAERLAERRDAGKEPDVSSLTKRELQILTLIAEGLSVKEIALRCELSIHTVYTHRKNILEKLGLQTSAELMRFVIRSGLIPF